MYTRLLLDGYIRKAPLGSPADSMAWNTAVATAIALKHGAPLDVVTRAMSDIEIRPT